MIWIKNIVKQRKINRLQSLGENIFKIVQYFTILFS